MIDTVCHMTSFTLGEAARALDVPQHKLIHLCEKNVVVPDVRDARGRGSSRKFSKRNLFDFAVALEMRRLELPVSYIQAVLRVLRAFEGEARTLLRNFALPESLLATGAPRLSLLILNGEQLFFTLTHASGPAQVFGGVNIRHPSARGRSRQHQSIGRLKPDRAEQALSATRTKTEVDLSRIARDLGDRLPGS